MVACTATPPVEVHVQFLLMSGDGILGLTELNGVLLPVRSTEIGEVKPDGDDSQADVFAFPSSSCVNKPKHSLKATAFSIGSSAAICAAPSKLP